MPQAPIQIPASGVHSGSEIGGLMSAALYAVATMQAGATPPAAADLGLSSLAGIWFHNIPLGVVYVRDQADTIWMPVYQIDESAKVVVPLAGGIPLYGAPVLAGGTADALTATFHPVPTALVDGGLYPVRAAAANATTTPTINVNGIGATTICKTGGVALTVGDIRAAGDELLLRYNGSSHFMELIDPAGAGVGAVLGPASSADNDLVLFSGTGGKLLKTSTAANMRTLMGLGTAAVAATGNSVVAISGSLECAAPVVALSGATTVAATHRGKVLACTGTWTLTLTAAATLTNGFFCQIYNVGAGAITIDPNAAETINGAATLVLGAGQSGTLYCDGAGWRMTGVTASSGGLTLFRLTDATDIVLATCAAGGTRVGGSFSANIPATGVVRIAITQAQFNATIASNMGIGMGIEINGTTYFLQSAVYNGSVYGPSWVCLVSPTTIKGSVSTTYQNGGSGQIGSSIFAMEFDVGALGCATGTQTCYVRLGGTSNPIYTDIPTVKGTVTPTRIAVEVLS